MPVSWKPVSSKLYTVQMLSSPPVATKFAEGENEQVLFQGQGKIIICLIFVEKASETSNLESCDTLAKCLSSFDQSTANTLLLWPVKVLLCCKEQLAMAKFLVCWNTNTN